MARDFGADREGLGRNQRMIEVLSTHYLGPKKSIAVVRVAGRVLVLGVSNESINLITQLSGEDAAESIDLGEFGLPKGPSAPSRGVGAGGAAGTGATAAGNAIFADLLQTERAKSGPNVRAQIRNRLEGLKQL